MKFSVKKSMGVIGCLVIYAVCLWSIWKDVSLVSAVLWPLCLFVAAMFGIKKFMTGNGGVPKP